MGIIIFISIIYIEFNQKKIIEIGNHIHFYKKNTTRNQVKLKKDIIYFKPYDINFKDPNLNDKFCRNKKSKIE